MSLMEVLLLRRLSCVAAYATPKLETALVREAADGLSSTAFMPYPCCKAGVAVKDAMLMAVAQKGRNAAKSMSLVGLSPRMIRELHYSAKRPV